MLKENHHYYLHYHDEVVDGKYNYEMCHDFAPPPFGNPEDKIPIFANGGAAK